MKYLIIILAFSGLIAGCSTQANEPQVDLAQLQQQLADIQTYIDSGTCTNESGCSYIAAGKKPCGGPERYLVFSTSLDIEVLKNMVEAYTKAQEAYIKRTGSISDCRMVTPPNLLGCENGKCTIIE